METQKTIDRPAKLRAMLALYNISKGDFAASLDVGRTYLSKVLQGDEKPSLGLLDKACAILSKHSGQQVTIGDIWE